MVFSDELKARAARNLANPAVVTDEVVEIASSEAESICAGRTVADWAKLDIGMYRLKVNLKIGISDADQFALKEAMREVKSSPLVSDEGETSYGGIAVRQGENQWL